MGKLSIFFLFIPSNMSSTEKHQPVRHRVGSVCLQRTQSAWGCNIIWRVAASVLDRMFLFEYNKYVVRFLSYPIYFILFFFPHQLPFVWAWILDWKCRTGGAWSVNKKIRPLLNKICIEALYWDTHDHDPNLCLTKKIGSISKFTEINRCWIEERWAMIINHIFASHIYWRPKWHIICLCLIFINLKSSLQTFASVISLHSLWD